MVGKGVDSKSSRIFHQCYVKCCKLQNLTPLSNVLPSDSGRRLDFCVDRLKYAEWGPILNALSCDLSLHTVALRCRQQVKTVLEQIDCERLAKTVNKRAVILTNFMLSNLVEAVSQCLANTTLLTTLHIEGLPLKIPYLNPLCEAILANSSLRHLYLPRCLVGDAGCLAICKAVRCLPNILTLDLSGCELTPLGASYIADLVKYQKIHRYSENWMHTLRYRLPELDAMAGLRRITVCGNPGLGDPGVMHLMDVLADDLWIKALDVQHCGLTEESGSRALSLMSSNTSLVVLDLRHNDVASDTMSQLRAALRHNERGAAGQYVWLSSSSTSCDSRAMKSINKNGVSNKDRSNTNKTNTKYGNKVATVKKEKEYTEVLEEQLQEETSHRQQLEELNQQLIDQMKQLKQQHVRMWTNNGATSSGSEVSWLSSEPSSSSSSSVPIDQNTLCYIQRAFQDIYSYIVDNQCRGECAPTPTPEALRHESEGERRASDGVNTNTSMVVTRRAHSTHEALAPTVGAPAQKATKSAHLLGDLHKLIADMRPEMLEKHVGDTTGAHARPHSHDDVGLLHKLKLQQSNGRLSSRGSVVSDSSDTVVCSPRVTERPANGADCTVSAINPRDAFSSSDEET